MFAHTSFSYTNSEQEKLDVAGRFFSKERNTLVLHFCFVKKNIVWEFLFILNPLLIVYSNLSLKGTVRCLFIQSVAY